jgi:hypothetical protein
MNDFLPPIPSSSSPSPLLPVALSTHVDIELIDVSGESERLAFDLVLDDQADFYAGFLGESTPLAQAILGRSAGEYVAYHQAGETSQVRLLSVSASTRQPSPDRAARRQEVIRAAVAQSELKNFLAVATAVDNKWGDYDPEALVKDLDRRSFTSQGNSDNTDLMEAH